MRKSIVIFIVFCGVVIGAIVYWHWQNASPPAPALITKSSPNQTKTSLPEITATPAAPKPAITKNTEPPAPKPVGAPSGVAAAPTQTTNAISKAVDALLSAKNGAEKHALFQQLAQAGELDQVIAELRKRAADNPNDAEIPTTLGEALLNKIRAITSAGGANNDQMGILAMEADQDFNTALQIDPQNWEAQFVKAASMYYWPANATRDNEVVQQLSSLIDQQETMTPQPEFAQTYLVLGNEYQKIGQPEKALATWQLGLQKFPNSTELQQKVNGQ
jgi:tetratricopeptide (TPR) repeat protein